MNSDEIHVALLNATFMQIAADEGILRELHEYFTFDVPGAKFMPLYKHKVWDGKKRLFNLANQTLYTGLFFKLEEFAGSRQLKIISYDESLCASDKKCNTGDFKAFLGDLSPQSKNEDIKPHLYQEEAILYCINNPRSTVVSPTSSGKSLIIYSLIRWYLNQNPSMNILLVVPTVSLVLQMYSDFQDYSTKNGFNTEKHCHKIYSGQEKSTNKPVIISTWQSMQNMKKQYFQRFDMVIVDEVHGAASKELSSIMESSSNAYIRYGFTGTLQDTKCHKLVILGHFGAEKKVIETKELMDKGFISQLMINCIVFEYTEESAIELRKKITAAKKGKNKKSVAAIGYATEIDHIVSHEDRMNNLVALSLSLKNNSLILFNLVDKHGKVIYNRIKFEIENRKIDKKVYFIDGSVKAETREDYRALMEKNDNIILVASYGTTSTGVSIKNIHNVIFASPSKSKIKVLQSIGRGLRKNENKDRVVLYDIVDKISYTTKQGNEKTNYVFHHFLERWKIYKHEGFNYKIHSRKIK